MKKKNIKISVIIVGIIGLIFYMYILSGAMYPEPSPPSTYKIPVTKKPDMKDMVTEIRVKPGQIIREYKNNRIAADKKFKNKILEIPGYITHIDIGMGGYPYIRLGGVTAEFSKDFIDKISQLNNGQFIIIKGKCSGKGVSVRIKDCIITDA